MKNRFDFEQQIMDCWGVVDDIAVLNSQFQDAPEPMSHDQVANYLLGMETIYQVKFEQLFATFEALIKARQL